MAIIQSGNWSFRDPGDEIPDGSTIESGNFTQIHPDTQILAGKTITINGGNWTNVLKDPAWIVNGGHWGRVDRCSNLHPDWVAKGRLFPEQPDCIHVVDTDLVYVDGVLVDTIYYYQDTFQ